MWDVMIFYIFMIQKAKVSKISSLPLGRRYSTGYALDSRRILSCMQLVINFVLT
jgi:hypothetical protein